MYTVSKGPSKIVQKTRRGFNKKFESGSSNEVVVSSSDLTTTFIPRTLTFTKSASSPVRFTNVMKSHHGPGGPGSGGGGGHHHHHHHGHHHGGGGGRGGYSRGGHHHGGDRGHHHHHHHHHHGYANSSSAFSGGGGHGSPSSSSSSGPKARYYSRNSQEKVSPQQEDIIRFVHDKWTAVEEEIKRAKEGKPGAPEVIVYQEQEPNPHLKDFEPFDLESWWGKRVYKNLTQGP